MNKELADSIIFNSIFNSVTKSGFDGLIYPLEVIEPNSSILNSTGVLDAESGDYSYSKQAFRKVSDSQTFKYAGIKEPFNKESQKEWFLKALKSPNSFMKYKISEFLGKLNLNSRLRSKLGDEFVSILKESVNIETKNNSTIEENSNRFTAKEFQDLVFISSAETIYNPEIEDKISSSFIESNSMFWNRFMYLYENVFKNKFGESEIFNENFFNNERIQKDKKNYGFDILEDALTDSYPKYNPKFQPYLNMLNEDYKNKTNNPEYINFRNEEFNLYEKLCKQYNIKPIRKTVI